MKRLLCVVVLLTALTLFGISRAQLQSWPDLVGKTFAEAKAAILADDPTLNVIRVPEGSAVTADFRLDRVRVFVDECDIVVRVPSVG